MEVAVASKNVEGGASAVRYFSKKYGGFYSLRYNSPKTGKLTHVPLKKTGRLKSPEEAIEWAERHLKAIIHDEIKLLERQNWRSNVTLTKHFEDYKVFRVEQNPRSAAQDLSMLSNFGIPFLVGVIGERDPNHWWEYNEELLEWLKKDAKTRKGRVLAVSSGNKVVNSLNHFLKWMKRKKIIEHSNFRSFEGFDQRKQKRRGSQDLLSPEVFNKIHTYFSSRYPLFADLWLTQRNMGFRVNEMLGLPFNWLSEDCPSFIKEEFERKGVKVFGSIYLESQPAKPYIKRVKGVIERAPLKWRNEISIDNARTIPILSAQLWNLLVGRYETQSELWEKKDHGPIKESYLIFDGAQRNLYLEAIREACSSLGLESCASHILRHTLSTEWTALKISDKVSELVFGHKAQAHSRYVHIVGQVNAETLKMAPVKRLTKIADSA